MHVQILMGQKYGYRPFPPKIDALEFEVIRKELEAMKVDGKLLDLWFKKNTNVVPAVYVLQPISHLFPDYINKVAFYELTLISTTNLINKNYLNESPMRLD